MSTINSGYLDISPNENRVLATVTHAGCIWEVDVDSRKVVWEYIAGAKTRDQSRLKIGFAKYVTRPSFLMQPNETSLSQHELNLESEN